MLIGLHGKKGAGKDEVYRRASLIYGSHVEVVRIGFADAMKKSVARTFDISLEQIEHWKNDPSVEVRIFTGSTPVWMTFRRFLQRYGTEGHRDLWPDVWVNALNLPSLKHTGRLVFVTDVRFENEAEAIYEVGGHVWRVLGPEGETDVHASEKPLPSAFVSYVVENQIRDDDFQSLDEQIKALVYGNWQTLESQSGPSN